MWDVEYTEEFGDWWESLTADEQEDVRFVVDLLAELGPSLGFPYSSRIVKSRVGLRELRAQHAGRPYRVLYTFDPRRTGILLLGGDKTGHNRWYDVNVPKAEKIYKRHLEELNRGEKME